MWEEESNLYPNCCFAGRNISLSEHRGIAQGWPVVNRLGVTEPIVEWKKKPLLAVASHVLVLISVFILCALK